MHSFFKDLNWDQLLKKQIKAPVRSVEADEEET